MEKMYFEISLVADRRDMASILVANDYKVGMETVDVGKGKPRKMLAVWKDEEKKGE